MEVEVIAKRWEVRGWSDWEPFHNRKARWNWIDFTFITITVERSDYLSAGRWEIHVGVLGLHVEIARRGRVRP
jgi:hypothetical protein